MTTYNVSFDGDVIWVGFGDPAANDRIVVDAKNGIDAIKDQVMGKVAKINGPASLPVAMCIGHALAHICTAVACFDPDLGKYVVAISHHPHHPDYLVGDLID